MTSALERQWILIDAMWGRCDGNEIAEEEFQGLLGEGMKAASKQDLYGAAIWLFCGGYALKRMEDWFATRLICAGTDEYDEIMAAQDLLGL